LGQLQVLVLVARALTVLGCALVLVGFVADGYRRYSLLRRRYNLLFQVDFYVDKAVPLMSWLKASVTLLPVAAEV
jgi:hypothetical protein